MSEGERCSDVRCDQPADAIYSNGVFVEPRCEDHATGDHLTVVRSLNTDIEVENQQ